MKQLIINSMDLGTITQKLKENGVVLIPEYLKKESLVPLNTEFDQFLKATGEESYVERTPYSEGEAARVSTYDLPNHQYVTTREVFLDAFMNKVSEAYFQGQSFKLNDQIFAVKDVVGSKHIANDLHFDVIPTLKFFIYLSDTTAENGAFSCVPGSHSLTADIRKQYPDLDYDKREVSRKHEFSEDEIIPIEGLAGTLIIFTTETFHRAGTVSKGERRVMRGHTRIKRESKKGFLRSLFNR